MTPLATAMMLLGIIVAISCGWPGVIVGLLALGLEIAVTTYALLNPT